MYRAMKLTVLACVAVAAAAAGAAHGAMVVQRWGKYRYTQHKEVEFQSGAAGTTMTVDLSAIPKGAAVCRARLVFTAGDGYEVSAGDQDLRLVEPYCLWFDATEAARAWVREGKGKGVLTIRRANGFRPENAYLEIAYLLSADRQAAEGELKEKPPQVTELKPFHRDGQTFLTWKELEDLAEGKEDVTWGEMAEKVRAANPMVGIIPKWPQREIRYSVYRHDEPITPANIGQAEFIHDVMQGSVYAEDAIATGRQGEQGPVYLMSGQVLRRVMLEKDKFLPPGTAYHWVTARDAGKGIASSAGGQAYYAVLASINGVENTTDIGPPNAVGPVAEKVVPPRPLLVAETVTKLRSPEGAAYHEQWYSWWCLPPLSAYPRRYDVAVGFCPQTMEKPAALAITREAWNYPIRMPRPEPRKDVVLAHTMDLPIAFRMGPNDSHYSLKSFRQGKWRLWPMRRQEALIEWMTERFGIDPNRITVGMGAWGMAEIERPDLYAMIHGYGQPEVTKGFQCWNRAQGVWGPPSTYAGRPAEEDPFLRSDYSSYVLARPERETPFFLMYAIRSAHLTEMGWPALPRFWAAMIESRHPFVYDWRAKHRPTFRRDCSVPAFGNCSLDGNPGNGDLRQGQTFDTPINSWLSWDSESIVDGPARWEITVLLDEAAPLPECTVDLTPRRVQNFRAKGGEEFTFTNALLPQESKGAASAGKAVQSGNALADRWGLVTIKGLRVTTARHRVVIAKR